MERFLLAMGLPAGWVIALGTGVKSSVDRLSVRSAGEAGMGDGGHHSTPLRGKGEGRLSLLGTRGVYLFLAVTWPLGLAALTLYAVRPLLKGGQERA